MIDNMVTVIRISISDPKDLIEKCNSSLNFITQNVKRRF